MDQAAKLRRWIRDNYPSEAAFARTAEITPGALSKYLSGRKPREDERVRIWKLSGIDLNALPPLGESTTTSEAPAA